MHSVIFVLVHLLACCYSNKSKMDAGGETSESDKPIYQYIPTSTYDPPPSYGFQVVNQGPYLPANINTEKIHKSDLGANPLLAALILSSSLGIPHQATPGFNHPQHLPINPYVALLLSHYGRYINVPYHRTQRGIYGYTAANNYHNNKPFGSYKIIEDA